MTTPVTKKRPLTDTAELCEAAGTEDGFEQSWSEGLVLARRKKEGSSKVTVKFLYSHLKSDTGGDLIEELDPSVIRPAYPVESSLASVEYAEGDEVDVLLDDVWWEGVVRDQSSRSVVVETHCDSEYASISRRKVRPGLNYNSKTGKWSKRIGDPSKRLAPKPSPSKPKSPTRRTPKSLGVSPSINKQRIASPKVVRSSRGGSQLLAPTPSSAALPASPSRTTRTSLATPTATSDSATTVTRRASARTPTRRTPPRTRHTPRPVAPPKYPNPSGEIDKGSVSDLNTANEDLSMTALEWSGLVGFVGIVFGVLQLYKHLSEKTG